MVGPGNTGRGDRPAAGMLAWPRWRVGLVTLSRSPVPAASSRGTEGSPDLSLRTTEEAEGWQPKT